MTANPYKASEKIERSYNAGGKTHDVHIPFGERDSEVISTVKIEGRNILYRVWTAVGFPFSGGRPHTHVPMDSPNWA